MPTQTGPIVNDTDGPRIGVQRQIKPAIFTGQFWTQAVTEEDAKRQINRQRERILRDPRVLPGTERWHKAFAETGEEYLGWSTGISSEPTE